ncbi:MAG: histidinol-phosphate transaminase [Kiritimatiellia bacterium]
MRIARSVRKLEPYVPGEQPKSGRVLKLNTNENPYPPSPKCAAILRGFNLDRLRRYPDPNFGALRAALAKLNGASPEQVFVGNGSDEVLALAARAFVENDEEIGSLDPSYSLYKTLAAIRDVPWRGLRLEDAAAARKVALFLLTNPNAPTGEFREPAAVAAFAKRFKGVVLVDEAYADFARANCMALATTASNRNLIVMRTCSKSYSLAGLRVGYCVGPKDLIDALYKVKDSYNVDAVAQAVALAAVGDQRWMRANVAKVVATRGRVAAELRRRGWDVPDSEANFLFARPPRGVKAEDLFDALRRRNVFVRHFRGPGTGDRLRITIGTDAQMRKFLSVLKGMGV